MGYFEVSVEPVEGRVRNFAIISLFNFKKEPDV